MHLLSNFSLVLFSHNWMNKWNTSQAFCCNKTVLCTQTHLVLPYFVPSHLNVFPHSGFRQNFIAASQTAAWGPNCILVTVLSHSQQGLISDGASGGESQAVKNEEVLNEPPPPPPSNPTGWRGPRRANMIDSNTHTGTERRQANGRPHDALIST